LLKRAIGLQKEMRLAYFDLGCIYADRGESRPALEYFQHAVKIDPTQPDAHYRLARLYSRIGDKQKAAVEFAKTKELHRKTEELLIQKVSGNDGVGPP
jgi:Tfp pilus assembly protein PilF